MNVRPCHFQCNFSHETFQRRVEERSAESGFSNSGSAALSPFGAAATRRRRSASPGDAASVIRDGETQRITQSVSPPLPCRRGEVTA